MICSIAGPDVRADVSPPPRYSAENVGVYSMPATADFISLSFGLAFRNIMQAHMPEWFMRREAAHLPTICCL